MSLAFRCAECGSWGEECASDTAQRDCACARCLRAEVERLKAALRDIVAIGERCNCDGYCGPCGCGDRAEDCAREALEEVEK